MTLSYLKSKFLWVVPPRYNSDAKRYTSLVSFRKLIANLVADLWKAKDFNEV